ncbi:MAG: class I SAM-dependent methyltransferase [Candidatus Binataceae bacterium]|nr:class I SAM-dependent methyltransferase [Candidatus Binataceae bacterium]
MAEGKMVNVEASEITGRAQIRAQIEKLYREGMVHGDDGFSQSLYPTSVTPGRGKFLGDLVRRIKPAATIEVGMGWGLSTLHMLEAMLENGGVRQPHIIMDPYQAKNYHNGARRVLREAGVDGLVEFHQEPSEIFLPKLVEQGRRFDFAFIDGDHRFDGAFVDLVFIHKLLKPGGVMAVDDTELDAVHLACQFAITNWGYTFEAGHSDREASPGRHRHRGEQPRPQVGAYRKPLVEGERNQLHFNSFFDDFSPYIRLNRLASNQLAHEGLVALREGDREAARRSFREAIRQDPTHAKNLFRYIRTYLPPGLARAFTGRSKRG